MTPFPFLAPLPYFATREVVRRAVGMNQLAGLPGVYLKDGSVNVADVQLAVNQALAITACSTGDVNGDAVCNVSDVQLVVNKALGL